MKPLICLAAEAPNAYAAARLYAAQGMSVIPCKGKKPAVYWDHLKTRAALTRTIDLWHSSGLLQNVGIICGQVSGGLVVMDLDGEAAIEAFYHHFPGLGNTYSVRSGSGVGMHLYYTVRELTPTTRVTATRYGNIELRSDGAYVVAPPSIHPDSHKAYFVANTAELLVLDDLRGVVEWIKALIREKHGGVMPPPSNKRPIRDLSAYGAVALRNEAAEVARAQPGERNNRLYRAALKMGSLIRDGRIERASVEADLFAAASALTQQDGEAATRKTIHSGIEIGLQSSRSAWKEKA